MSFKLSLILFFASTSKEVFGQIFYIPPVLIYEPFDFEAIPGSSIELLCGAEGQPPPIITWRKDRLRLTNSEKYRITSTGISIANINEVDAGNYECFASNDVGSVSVSSVLTVREREESAPGDNLLKAAFLETQSEIDAALNPKLAETFRNSSINSDNNLFRIVRYSKVKELGFVRSSEIFERTLINIRRRLNPALNFTATLYDFNYNNLLSPEYLDLLGQLSDCKGQLLTPNCTNLCFHNKYRNIDGTCNNFDNPLWGTYLSKFRRLLPSNYDNGISSPKGWQKNAIFNGFRLPNPRTVSTSLLSTDIVEPDIKITGMVMQWGQFFAHDMDLAILSLSVNECKQTCNNVPPCFPIEVPKNDTRIKNRQCIEFLRSISTCGAGILSDSTGKIQPYEQVNQNTAFIDASVVYGSDEKIARYLRDISLDDKDLGYLKTGIQLPDQKPMLPFALNSDGIDCKRSLDDSIVDCFLAGDPRVNEQIGLTTLHTIFVREHNRIAKFLNEINPHLNGEQIYQEARKIVGATVQHISLSWIRQIIGDDGIKLMGDYQGYNPNINPLISNEFTLCLRLGHGLINPFVFRLDSQFEVIEQGHLPLRNAFFAPWRIVYQGGVDPILRGLFAIPAKINKPQQTLNSDLTEHLFNPINGISSDLASLNIHRGRDHALGSYMQYRSFCNLSTSSTFEGLRDITDPTVRQKLRQLYGHPGNIDIWVGGILENLLPGARVGPLFRCILVDQFRRLRDGDRFWYENAGVFKPEQLAEIKRTSLARVLCDNGDNITQITDDVFMLPELQGGFKDCADIPKISLQAWADCSDCSNNPSRFESIFNKEGRIENLESLIEILTLNKVQYDLRDLKQSFYFQSMQNGQCERK